MNRDIDSGEYYDRCRESFSECQYDKSLVLCKRSIRSQSDHYDAHFCWSRNLSLKNASSQCVKKHKELIFRDPTDSDAYHNLGLEFERQGQLFEAETQYKKVLAISPFYYGSSHNLAIVLREQAKYTEALEEYERIIEKTPGDSLTYNCHGYMKFTLGKYEEAIKSFEEAMKKNPNYSLPFMNRSLALYCLGKSELAVEAFKESLGKVAENEDWKIRFEKNLCIYEGELRRFEKSLESGGLGEIPKETLVINIKALGFIVDSLKRVLLEKMLVNK